MRRLPAVAARQPVRAGVSVLQNEADAAAGGGTGALAAVLAAAARLRAAVPARLRAALAVGRPQAARRGARGALRGLFGGAGADRVALLGRGRFCRGAVRVRRSAGVRVSVPVRGSGQAARAAALRPAGVCLRRGAGDVGVCVFLFPAGTAAGLLPYAGGGREKPLFVRGAVRLRLRAGGGSSLYAGADRAGPAVRAVCEKERAGGAVPDVRLRGGRQRLPARFPRPRAAAGERLLRAGGVPART